MNRTIGPSKFCLSLGFIFSPLPTLYLLLALLSTPFFSSGPFTFTYPGNPLPGVDEHDVKRSLSVWKPFPPLAQASPLSHQSPRARRTTESRRPCVPDPWSLFWSNLLYLLLLLSTWGVTGRKRRLSAARRDAWVGGMLYRDSVSLTPLIQVFRGRPLALRPLNPVLYAR